jgi:hypothetical protein
MAKGCKTGGRKRGTRNKKTLETIERVMASGTAPLDYLLAVMRDEKADPVARFEAAKAAAPYCHPKLAAIEHRGEDDAPVNMTLNVAFTPEEAYMKMINFGK